MLAHGIAGLSGGNAEIPIGAVHALIGEAFDHQFPAELEGVVTLDPSQVGIPGGLLIPNILRKPPGPMVPPPKGLADRFTPPAKKSDKPVKFGK